MTDTAGPRAFTLSDFDFALPPDLIAQHPAPERMRRLLRAPIHRKLVAKYEAALAQGDLLA